MENHQGRVALVTGCGKRNGIGAAIARKLSRDGHAVMVADYAPAGVADSHEPANAADPQWRGVESLVDEIEGAGGVAVWATGDASNSDDVKKIVDATVEAFGSLDILVNNAGAPFSMGHGDIEAIDPDEWNEVLAINLTGSFLFCQGAARHMRKNKFGRIINIASVAGRSGSKANAAYAASKAGVIALTQSIALDMGGDGVTSNAILPGFILTTRSLSGMSKKLGVSEIDDETVKKSTPNIPAGRAGTPEDVAAAASFLASEGASYINGQSIIVDGGSLRI